MRVVSVSPDKATFEWKPVDMEPGQRRMGAKPTARMPKVDKLHGTVSFSLRMNQTFASYSMRVAEGAKMQPMAVPTSQLQFSRGRKIPHAIIARRRSRGRMVMAKAAAAAAMLPAQR